MKIGPKKVLAAGMVAAALVTAGCSSSGGNKNSAATNSSAVSNTSAAANSGSPSGGSSTTPTQGGGGSTSSGTKSPYVIGTFGDYSGIFADPIALNKDAMNAWAESVNASGGINGHPIKLITIDTGGVPTKALDAVKTLIEQDHVIAIVGQGSNFQPAWKDYANKAGVPIIGGTNEGQGYDDSPLFYTVQPSYTYQYGIPAVVAKQIGTKKIMVVSCTETPSCPTAVKALTDNAASMNIPAKSLLVPSTQSDYSSACLQTKSYGADMFAMFEGGTQAVNIANSCLRQNYKPTYVLQAQIASNKFLIPSLEGTLLTESVFPFWEDSTPAEHAFHEAMTKYAKNPASEQAAIAWVSGTVFATAAAKLGDNPTPADVVDALATIPDNSTFDGLTIPLSFAKGKVHTAKCFFLAQIKGQKFTNPPSGSADTPVC